MGVSARRPDSLRGRVFTSAEAVGSGLLTARQLRSPCWRRLLRGVYADSSWPVTHGLYVAAARLVVPTGTAFAGRSAAWLYGAEDLAGPEDPVEVLIDEAHRFGPVAGLVIRTERHIPPGHVVSVGNRVLTSGPRTAWDLPARRRISSRRVVVLDTLLRARVLRSRQLPLLSGPLRRLNALHAAGWRVIHVTAADLHDLGPILAAVRRGLAL